MQWLLNGLTTMASALAFLLIARAEAGNFAPEQTSHSSRATVKSTIEVFDMNTALPWKQPLGLLHSNTAMGLKGSGLRCLRLQAKSAVGSQVRSLPVYARSFGYIR